MQICGRVLKYRLKYRICDRLEYLPSPPSKGKDLSGRSFFRGGFKRSQKVEGGFCFNLVRERRVAPAGMWSAVGLRPLDPPASALLRRDKPLRFSAGFSMHRVRHMPAHSFRLAVHIVQCRYCGLSRYGCLRMFTDVGGLALWSPCAMEIQKPPRAPEFHVLPPYSSVVFRTHPYRHCPQYLLCTKCFANQQNTPALKRSEDAASFGGNRCLFFLTSAL